MTSAYDIFSQLLLVLLLIQNEAMETSARSPATDPEGDLLLCVNDYQCVCKLKLPKALYDYLASGTGDARTLQRNAVAFLRWHLRPRVMRNVSHLSTSTHLFGKPMSMPVFLSPAGVHGLCHNEGECGSARVCEDMNLMFGLSQHSTRSIEQVAKAAPNCVRFYQLYLLKSREITLDLVRRALQAGYSGIILTVDSVRFGYRECDARNGFNTLPPPHRLVNYDKYKASLDQSFRGQTYLAWDQNSELLFAQDLSWDDVRWLKAQCQGLPLIVKGIMTAEDAILAVEAGADAVMVSNHGGRQLDTCLGTIDVLPEVVAAVGSRVPVLLDGGVRRGTDVVKALALGATAVGLGKPLFFALAAGGPPALRHMLQLLNTEIEAAMALCGCATVNDIARSHVTRSAHL